MDTFQILILALVQGLTEFLPISSSAHLILTPYVFGYRDQGLAFDVAVHIGSLAAVVMYFKRDIAVMITDLVGSLGRSGKATNNSRLAWLIVFSTVPIMVVGAIFKSIVETDFRSLSVIAATTIVFGMLLYWADRTGKRYRDEFSVNWRDALIIGLFQVLAIIPGTSRSGITMTAGLMLGLTRNAASRFSFLLSIPTILMSGTLVTFDLIQTETAVNWNELLLGALLSFISAYSCIVLFLKMIERIGMFPFFIYRMLLGTLLLAIIAI